MLFGASVIGNISWQHQCTTIVHRPSQLHTNNKWLHRLGLQELLPLHCFLLCKRLYIVCTYPVYAAECTILTLHKIRTKLACNASIVTTHSCCVHWLQKSAYAHSKATQLGPFWMLSGLRSCLDRPGGDMAVRETIGAMMSCGNSTQPPHTHLVEKRPCLLMTIYIYDGWINRAVFCWGGVVMVMVDQSTSSWRAAAASTQQFSITS